MFFWKFIHSFFDLLFFVSHRYNDISIEIIIPLYYYVTIHISTTQSQMSISMSISVFTQSYSKVSNLQINLAYIIMMKPQFPNKETLAWSIIRAFGMDVQPEDTTLWVDMIHCNVTTMLVKNIPRIFKSMRFAVVNGNLIFLMIFSIIF